MLPQLQFYRESTLFDCQQEYQRLNKGLWYSRRGHGTLIIHRLLKIIQSIIPLRQELDPFMHNL